MSVYDGEAIRRVVPRLDSELLEASVERTAILTIAVKRLARIHHRTHAPHQYGAATDSTYENCAHDLCRFAHGAVLGRFVLGPPQRNGVITTLVEAVPVAVPDIPVPHDPADSFAEAQQRRTRRGTLAPETLARSPETRARMRAARLAYWANKREREKEMIA